MPGKNGALIFIVRPIFFYGNEKKCKPKPLLALGFSNLHKKYFAKGLQK
jgi:hypothetical protein